MDAVTFTVTATAEYVWITALVATADQAREIAAQFPKSAKVLGSTLTGWNGTERIETGYVSWKAKIATDGVNGGRNETGIKRYRAVRKQIAKLGHVAQYEAAYNNSIPSETELDALLSA